MLTKIQRIINRKQTLKKYNNKPEVQKRVKLWHIANKDKVKKRNHLYRLMHKEELKQRDRDKYIKNKKKIKIRSKQYRLEHRDERLMKARKYQRTHRDLYNSWKLRDRYGLTSKQREKLLYKQHNKCACCGASFKKMKSKNRHIDHNHKTKHIRGILCHNCNTALGMLHDDITRVRLLYKYIKKTNKKSYNVLKGIENVE